MMINYKFFVKHQCTLTSLKIWFVTLTFFLHLWKSIQNSPNHGLIFSCSRVKLVKYSSNPNNFLFSGRTARAPSRTICCWSWLLSGFRNSLWLLFDQASLPIQTYLSPTPSLFADSKTFRVVTFSANSTTTVKNKTWY